MILRPHQELAIEMLRDSMRRGNKRIVLAAACAFGKTVVASAMIQSAVEKGKRCCFIVDRVELVDQASRRLTQDGIDHGIIQGDHPLTDYSKQVQIATIQTLKNRTVKEFDFAIIDEVHCLFQTHIEYMERYNNVPFIGLTATPFRKGMGKIFQDLVVPITVKELTEQGYLCPYEVFAPCQPDLDGLKIVRGDYDESMLAERVSTPKLVGDIVETHQRLAKGQKTIVFAVNIAHSKFIVEEFKRIGLNAVHVDCYTDKGVRDLINKKAQDGEIDILSCVSIYEKGWDAPIFSCMIDAGPTKSVIKYVQRIGRILRTHPGKTVARILDHSGNTIEHGWIEDIIPDHLDTEDKPESEQVKKKEKKEKLYICEKCGAVGDTFACGACGHVGQIRKDVVHINGNLEKQSKPLPTTAEKQDWYAMFKYIAIEKGYKDGWPYFQMKKKFGATIKQKAGIEPKPPTIECRNWIKSQQIRYAKGMEKRHAVSN